MPELRGLIGKLRGRSADEFRERGAQALAALRERRGWSDQIHVPDDRTFLASAVDRSVPGGEANAERLLEAFRVRAASAFFPSFGDREGTLAELRRRFPYAEREAVEDAERVCAGRFHLLGYRDLDFGDPIDWHRDPVAGKTAPLLHWSRIPFLDAGAVGDHKVIWELNRHQHFLTLGRAYAYTGDERFARTFAEHLAAWMDANPPKTGINWASSLELAFRSIAWIWAFAFFRDSPHLSPALFLRALKFVELQARHVERYLSTYFSPNTHLTGEALGLFYVGTLFPELRAAARWRARGRQILIGQLDAQIRLDGTYFEQASYYARYTADFYLHFWLLGRANGDPAHPKVRAKLALLLDHLMHLTRPDGTTPRLGDDDGGRLVWLERRAPDDFRPSLATGAVLLQRPDLRFVAGEASEETLWLLGGEGAREFDALPASPPSATSRAFGAGGFYVMRDGWSRDANFLLVDCGPHGIFNCGHAHADVLAIEVAARGRTMLVDPGTYTYTADPEQRDRFRSSHAHNTLTVDGESSSVPDGPFTWSHVARATLRGWIARERFDFFDGEHDGFQRLEDPATHRRTIFFPKGRYWIVRDRVTSAGAHRVEARFHFAPGTRVAERSAGVVATAEVSLQLAAPGAETSMRCEQGAVSPAYGSRSPAPVCSREGEGEGDQEWFSFLIPRADGEALAEVREEEASGGRIFGVDFPGEHDLLALADPGASVRGCGVETDFGWAWLRSGAEGALTECVVLDGRVLAWKGEEVIRSEEPIGFLALHRDGDTLRVDTDAGGSWEIASLGAARVVVNGEALPPDGRGRCIVRSASPSPARAARRERVTQTTSE